MKKFLVALMVICVALSCFSFAVLAEEAPAGDAQGAAKTVESLVGAYYLQGECGYGAVPGGGTYQTEYDWTIADQLAKALNGTNRIPFYAGQNEDGSLFFDRMAQQAFKYEIEYAIASGIDFIAYRYYPGFGTSGGKKRTLQFMNNQLKMHSTLAGQAVGFSKEVDFALVLDEDFNAAKDADLIIDEYIVVKGYLTAADGRPVVFILWNDNIATQISSTNKKLKKVILDTGKEKLDLEVEHVKFFKQFVIVKFKEFDNINDIERYKRCPLLVTRENAVPLEEDEYFVADMIGMKVITEDGTEFGTLSDVMETGANDVYVIDSKEHGEVLMPAIKECVLNVDMESGIITVHLMNGLI